MNATDKANIEINRLKQELEEANDLIEAIKTGSIDALAIHSKDGPQIYTLKSADVSYRLLVEQMNEGAVILDEKGFVLFGNATFATFIGVPLEHVVGTRFIDFIEENFLQTFQQLFQEGWKNSSKGEIAVKQKIGRLMPFSISINPMELNDIPALGIIITDLSAKNEIEFIRSQVAEQNKVIAEKNKALLKQELGNEEANRLKFILEGISHMTWTNLENGAFNFYNQRWNDFTGQTLEEAKKTGWKSVIHPDDLAHTTKAYHEALTSGTLFEVENRYRRASDGSYRWHINRAMPIKNAQGEIILWVGTATDIHDQKQSEEKFRFLAETVPQIFWTADADGNLDYFNQRWYSYSGLSFEQSREWGWVDVLHPDDLQRSKEVWRSSLQTGNDYQIEYRFKRDADQVYRWHLSRAQALKDKDGKVIKWFGTSTDIHEQKEAMENLFRAQEQLKIYNMNLNEKNEQLIKINNDLDNFIYTASHDLKAPVSNIEGLIITLEEVLIHEIGSQPEIKYIIQLIHDSISRFKATILDLTEITKIQKGIGEDMEIQNICHVVETVKSNISEIIKKEDAVIEMDLLCPEIHYSKKNLYSILYNLISNSIKYRSFDKAPVIIISTEIRENFLVMSLKDNGLGMNLTKDTKIFSMFKRLHDHVEGSGVGLYLVKRIVDNAGGRIEVESEIGKGTTFRIYFRLGPEQLPVPSGLST